MKLPNTPRETAHFYAEAFEKPIFPVRVIVFRDGTARKCPAIRKRDGGRGHLDATCDRDTIERWWRKHPDAYVGMPTGLASGLVVIDIDNKEGRNGFHTLADHYALYDLPETPWVFTRSAGLHCHFAYDGKPEIRNSEGTHGLGPGVDIRGEGGWVVLPCPGSGYSWHSKFNFATIAPMPAPAWLGHKQKPPRSVTVHGARHGRFDPQAVLADCCDQIRNAVDSKYRTVRREAFIAATLVRDRFISDRHARHELEAALTIMGQRVKDYDHMVAAYEGAYAEGFAAPSARRAGR